MTEPISGVAAGVPFTALPPAVPLSGPAPLVIAWHMLDAPCTDAAFAAALPLDDLPAWRVYLGMPMCGARSAPSGREAIIDLAREDIVLRYVDGLVRKAVGEFPAALAAVRERFDIAERPIAVVGGSLGGAVASLVLAESPVPIAAAALINAGIRARSVASLVERGQGIPYTWTDAARQAADRLDFVARAEDIAAGGAAVLVVSGELDYPELRADAIDLADALGTDLVSVPGLDHPLAQRPGTEPAPQIPNAKVVDEAVTAWFLRHCFSGAERGLRLG
jgi:pimeloyl-ACP methyl ester carboxylesterase